MINEEFQTVGLYEHNIDSYKKVKRAYESGQKIVGIVHATGTGKSYNALQLAYDNKDKKIVYVVPSNGIIEHIKNIIEANPNLDMQRDFPNLEFRTYQSFVSLDRKEIANIPCDLLILDEFHHIGAPVWGARVNTMFETHPKMKVFGMTAYTVRDRGTSYERDMANPDTDELFSRKIESRYDLCDAMIDGIIPKPVYKSAYTNLIGLESKLEEKVQKLNSSSQEYQENMAILLNVKRRIHEAPSIPSILRKSIKPNGKYIYFCPPCSENGTNDIETIKKQAIEWFREFVSAEDIVIYTSTSEMGKVGKHNRDAFYDDVTLDGQKVDDKLRVMFAINQYNEGVHAPNIDGVIMGRGTTSDIVYFEQLGRALSVRGNTKEMFEKLEKYSEEELVEMCKSKEIQVKDGTSKEELIEKLIAPVVIDLTNNYEFIKELENNLRDRIKEVQVRGSGTHRRVKIGDASFDIEMENQDLFQTLSYVLNKLTRTWDDYYLLAKAYYEHNGDLLVPVRFKTVDGYTYDENGIKLGCWIGFQREKYDALAEERKQQLAELGFVTSALIAIWDRNYKLAKAYYEHYGNLLVPHKFKTKDGYTYAEDGINLGNWVSNLRRNYTSLSEERKQKLIELGFATNVYNAIWEYNYKLAKVYHEHKGDLLVPHKFKTKDGYTYDENGIELGRWVKNQRVYYKFLSEERKQKLIELGYVTNVYNTNWENNYKLAKAYYEHKGNLLIPYKFKTKDGYTFDENGIKLGCWISRQRRYYDNLSEEQKQKLTELGFVTNVHNINWESNYNLAKTYYEHHGNLLVPIQFKTKDGYTYDENGIKLGHWIISQRKSYDSFSEERKQKLAEIGFVLSVKQNTSAIEDICSEYNIDKEKNKKVLRHISIQEMIAKIEFLNTNGISLVDEKGLLIDIFSMSTPGMKEKYDLSLEELLTEYYKKNQINKGV